MSITPGHLAILIGILLLLIARKTIWNATADLFLWGLDQIGGLVVRLINPIVSREAHEIMGGHVLHETITYRDGREEHLFHCDDTIQFTGGG